MSENPTITNVRCRFESLLYDAVSSQVYFGSGCSESGASTAPHPSASGLSTLSGLSFFWRHHLTRRRAAGHTVAGTWAALLRGMLPVALAKDSPTSPANETENDSPLNGPIGGSPFGKGRGGGVTEDSLCIHQSYHSEDYGFPFLAFLWEQGSLVLCSGGTSFCSVRFLVPFTFPLLSFNH